MISSTRSVATLLMITVLLAAAVSATDGVELQSDFLIEQPGNNATINVTADFNVSILTAYDNATYIDHSNVSFAPSTVTNTTIDLSWFNRTEPHGHYVANYTVTTTTDTTLTHRFTNLSANEVYAVRHNRTVAVTYGNTTDDGTFNFTSTATAGNAFQLWRAGSLRDWLKTTPRPFTPATTQVTIGGTYRGVQTVTAQNNRSDFTWPSVPTTRWVTAPNHCSQVNASTVDVPPGKTNHSVGFDCVPGSIGATILKVNAGQPSTDYTTHAYTTENLTIHSNAAANTTVVWPIQKDRLEQWRDREPDSATAHVDGSSQNISVRENETHVLVMIGPEHSLHQGTYTASMSYYYDTSGGTGGPLPDQEHNQSAPGGVTIAAPTITGQPGETVATRFTITNSAPTTRLLTVAPANNSVSGCDYVSLQRSEISTMYGETGEYRVSADSTVSPRLRVTIPEREVLYDTETNELYCEYNVTLADREVATFTVTVAAEQQWPARLNDWFEAHGLPAVVAPYAQCLDVQHNLNVAAGASESCPAEERVALEWAPTFPLGWGLLSGLLFGFAVSIRVGRNLL